MTASVELKKKLEGPTLNSKPKRNRISVSIRAKAKNPKNNNPTNNPNQKSHNHVTSANHKKKQRKNVELNRARKFASHGKKLNA